MSDASGGHANTERVRSNDGVQGTDGFKIIDGVRIHELQVIPDDRGYLMEMLRADSPDFQKFGQVYLTAVYPGVVKAWHCHQKQTDNFVCVSGMAKVGLYDAREDSPTKGQKMTVVMGWQRQLRLTIPPGVYHGFTAVGSKPALIINIPTEVYDRKNPDELRRPWDDREINYDWNVKNG